MDTIEKATSLLKEVKVGPVRLILGDEHSILVLKMLVKVYTPTTVSHMLVMRVDEPIYSIGANNSTQFQGITVTLQEAFRDMLPSNYLPIY